MEYQYIPFFYSDRGMVPYYLGKMPYDKDIEYVKEMYPRAFMKLQLLVEQECDKQECFGSIMYDEYPDKGRLMLISSRLYDKLMEDNCKTKEDCIIYPEERWVKDTIQILLVNEMYRRRQRKGRFL